MEPKPCPRRSALRDFGCHMLVCLVQHHENIPENCQHTGDKIDLTADTLAVYQKRSSCDKKCIGFRFMHAGICEKRIDQCDCSADVVKLEDGKSDVHRHPFLVALRV